MTTVSRPGNGPAGEPAASLAQQGQQPIAGLAASPGWLTLPWLVSPFLQGALALAIYLVAWVPAGARSLVSHPGWAQVSQNNPDPNFYVWCLRWWPYAIGHGLNPLYSSQIFAPAGHSLAWVTTAGPLALLAAPLTELTGPLVPYNLLLALALPLAAWAAFVLCRRLAGKFWPALAGGAVFGFSAYELNHIAFGQLNTAYSLLLPILAYLVLLWRDDSISPRTFVILAATTMALQFYLFLETFADMSAILAVALVAGFALAARADRPAVLRLAKAIAAAYAISIVLAAPDLAYTLASRSPTPLRNSGLDLFSLVMPRPRQNLGIPWLAHLAHGVSGVSADGYVGVPLLVLAVMLAITGWSSRLVRFLTCMLIVIVIAAIGPEIILRGNHVAAVPWARLFQLPVVRNAYPARLMLFAFLALAVATALWLADTRHWARWPLGVLVLAAVVVNAAPVGTRADTTVPSFISSGQYRRNLRPGEIVIVVSKIRDAGMLWQAQSDFYMRLAGGFINEGFSYHRSDLPPPVQRLKVATPARVAAFEAYIKSSKIGAVLLDAAQEPTWAGIFPQMGLVGHRVGGVVIYVTDGCKSCRALETTAPSS